MQQRPRTSHHHSEALRGERSAATTEIGSSSVWALAALALVSRRHHDQHLRGPRAASQQVGSGPLDVQGTAGHLLRGRRGVEAEELDGGISRSAEVDGPGRVLDADLVAAPREVVHDAGQQGRQEG